MPTTFRKLKNITLDDVDRPDYAWLAYAVCAGEDGSCGWGGWIIESIYQFSAASRDATGRDKLLPADYDWKCPRCKRSLYRKARLRFIPSEDQSWNDGR